MISSKVNFSFDNSIESITLSKSNLLQPGICIFIIDSSLIVSINYRNTNYLFMGDSQNNRIKDYLSEHSDKEYDFIKIPYHGNYQKRLDDLLETTNPKYVVITCSATEPDITETIELLDELNIKYYLTKNGSITIKSDGENNVILKCKIDIEF